MGKAWRSWRDSPSNDRMTAALGGLFLLAVLYTLNIAQALVVPVVLALLLSALLQPLVDRLSRFLPRLLSAAIILLLLIGCLVLAGWRIQEPVARQMEDLPRRARQVEANLERLLRPIEPVQEATEQVEELAENLNEKNGRQRAPVVEVQASGGLSGQLMERMRNILLSLATLVAFAFFLLGSEHGILGKLLRLAPQFENRDAAQTVADCIEGDLARYLLTITGINLALGTSVALVMWAFDVPSPVFWGVAAAVANFIPYVGMITLVIVLSLTTSMSGDNWVMAVLPVAIYAALTITEGTFLTPLALGKRLELNPVAIFGGILFWGWMWGIVGVLLAVPLLVAAKIVAVNVSPEGPVADLLSR